MSTWYRFLLSIFSIWVLFSFGTFAQSVREINTSDIPQPNLVNSVATVAPSVTTLDASDVTQTSAKLNGAVNPMGDATTALFQWGLTTSYGTNTGNIFPGAGTSNVSINSTISGLTPNTLYHFRARATNGGGTTNGTDKTFKTLPDPPSVITLPASTIGMTSAILSGQGNPQGADANGWFQYDLDDTLDLVSDTSFLGNGNTFIPYSSFVDNLLPNTTYGYKAYAMNVGGTTGSEFFSTFTTLASLYEYYPDFYTVGLYHLNEQGTFIQDYSDYQNDGITSSSVSFGPPPSVEGKYGNARSFNSLDQYLEFPPSSDFDFNDGSFTLEAWVKPHLLGSVELYIVSYGNPNDSSEAFNFKITSDYRLFLSLSEEGFTKCTALTFDAPIVDDVWQHVAVVVDRTNEEIKFYYNGVLQPTDVVGLLPSIVYVTNAPLRVGLLSNFSTRNSGIFSSAIDEVRISSTDRQPSEFYFPGSISGMKFHDVNDNSSFDFGDSLLANWKIVLKGVRSSSQGTIFVKPETTLTDAAGHYAFTDLTPGKYEISEIQEPGWVQTYPATNSGKYIVDLTAGVSIPDQDFGNARGFVFLGTVDSSWDNPANWEGGQVPSDTSNVFLNSPVIFDVPADLFIRRLRLGSGGNLIFNPSTGPLHIQGNLEVDDGGALTLPDDLSLFIFCGGDFVNGGNFDPGLSNIVIEGDGSEIIFTPPSNSSVMKARSVSAFNGNQFYNLTITGPNTTADGNIQIANELFLYESLTLGDDDTLFIENEDFEAIRENGLLPQGTVKRKLALNTLEQYRFESEYTSVQFDGTGNPEYLLMTALPSQLPDTTTLKWLKVNALHDSIENTFITTGVGHFSKWVFGKPGAGMRKATSPSDYIKPEIQRSYVITTEGGGQFNATIQFHYEDSEVEDNETDLKLAYGAFFVDSVRSRWNMVSVPVIPDYFSKDSVFPTSISDAFKFDGAYAIEPTLSFGTGYWLKFAQNEEVSILGTDQSAGYFNVTQGWNLIGSISYPVDPAQTVLYGEGEGSSNLSATSYFGYDNGYFIADVLTPMRAYWVNVDESGTIGMDKDGLAPKRSSITSTLKQMNSLVVQDSKGSQQSLYFGFNSNLDVKKFTLPPAPPNGALYAHFASGSMLENLSGEQSKIAPLVISSSSLPYSIKWDMKDNTGSALLLIDGNAIPLRGSGSITVSSQHADVALKMDATPFSGMPKAFALHQNYPNPFNPATVIAFDLPTDELVTLKIYNILGQEVMTAIDRTEFKAGYHTHSLNTSQWASGVYFYKLSAGNYSSIKKMVLAR